MLLTLVAIRKRRRRGGIQMRRFLVVACMLWLGAAGVGGPSEDSIAKQFVGTWRLVSQTRTVADGTSTAFNNSGFLIYTDTGHMCAVLTPRDRPKWNIERPNAWTTNPAEALSAVTGSDGYCSQVEVNAKEGYALHHVEVSLRPNLIGATRKRSFEFDGPNRVVLRIDSSELTPPTVENKLVWERVQK
jgi:hypothetical protein